MKRPLHVVDELRDPPVWTPSLLRVGGRLVSVIDTGEGGATRRFAEALVRQGATRIAADADTNPDLHVVIRGAPSNVDARLRAEVLEEAADLVLGAARPAFARLFASACAPGVND